MTLFDTPEFETGDIVTRKIRFDRPGTEDYDDAQFRVIAVHGARLTVEPINGGASRPMAANNVKRVK